VTVTLHVLPRHWYYGILSEMQLRINIPPLTRVLLALLLAIFVTYQITRARHPEFLALIPQLSLLYPWVYFTATFAEQNILTLLVTAATILYGGKYLERAWGTTEFGKFVLVVTVIPYMAAAIVYLLWFVIARTDAHS
jgi:membrane associated rhomboid family serine protease